MSWRSWSKKRWSEAGFSGAPQHEEQAKKMALAAIRNISMSEFVAILGRKDEYAGHGSELYNAIINPTIRREMILKAFFGNKIPDMKIHRHKPVWGFVRIAAKSTTVFYFAAKQKCSSQSALTANR